MTVSQRLAFRLRSRFGDTGRRDNVTRCLPDRISRPPTECASPPLSTDLRATGAADHDPANRPSQCAARAGRRAGVFAKGRVRQSDARSRTRSASILVLAVLLLLAVSGRAMAVSLDGTWPDPGSLSGPAPVAVDLQSGDPFTPADAGLGRRRIVHALLYLPPGASASHPVPAIVLLHGSVGNYAERGFRYGLPLASMGVAVLVAETYASRPDLGRSFIGRALHITETMYDADAYAALDLLSRRSDIDGAHIGLIGFSYGGMATMYAMQRTLADRLARPGERFAAFVSYYGPCIARFDDVRTTGAPLLMMYGGQDELIHPDRCAAVASDLRRGGSAVDIRVFADAVHQWDGEMAPRLIGRHLADCDFRVDARGIVHDRNTGIVMTGPLTRGIILGLCTGSRPWPIGRDDAVVAQSDAALGGFLKARGFAP